MLGLLHFISTFLTSATRTSTCNRHRSSSSSKFRRESTILLFHVLQLFFLLLQLIGLGSMRLIQSFISCRFTVVVIVVVVVVSVTGAVSSSAFIYVIRKSCRRRRLLRFIGYMIYTVCVTLFLIRPTIRPSIDSIIIIIVG
jgi:hypothetical protein